MNTKLEEEIDTLIMNEEEHHMFDKKTVARVLCADIMAIFAVLIIITTTDTGLAIRLFAALIASVVWKVVYIVVASTDILDD